MVRTSFMTLAVVLVLLAGLSAAASPARRPRDGDAAAPFPLLPDYMSDVRHDQTRTPSKAEVRALTLAPRRDLSQCLGDLWWGIRDSARDVVDIGASCVSETVNEVKFLWDDGRKFVAKVAAEVRDVVVRCPQSGASRCVSQLLAVVGGELKPGALLVAAAVRLFLRIGYSALFELLGCTMLPALLPFVWNTLMDLLIFGQCLLAA
ncbi:hypothetical protein ONE63_010923 [Megalurothrips usitatus]|uniref:Uncharacterized protein n=1 Tax=Megalurothrips usitatus TaxID=439358 RepID=A0AAV7XJ47_9NEOP|nr:hypothetical protein ONE63_010923 [Megalurothrips usitatus]